jgi:ABC-type lipoprotein release transport system permease subunit
VTRAAWLLLAGTPRLPFVLALIFVTLVFAAHAALLALLDGPELLSPRGVERQILIMNRTSPVGALPASYQREIRSVRGVAGVSQLTFIGGYLAGEQRQPLVAIAVEPDELLAVSEDMDVPAIAARQWTRTPQGALVGLELARALQVGAGDRIAVATRLGRAASTGSNVLDLTVSGIYRNSADHAAAFGLYVHRRYFDEFAPQRVGDVGNLVALVDANSPLPEVGRAIEALFRHRPVPVRALPRNEVARYYSERFFRILDIWRFVAVASIGLVVLALALCLDFMVESTQHISYALRAFGYHRLKLSAAVMLVGIALGVSGGLAGAGLLFMFVDTLNARLSGVAVALNPQWAHLLTVSSIAAAAGALGALWPARRCQVLAERRGNAQVN